MAQEDVDRIDREIMALPDEEKLRFGGPVDFGVLCGESFHVGKSTSSVTTGGSEETDEKNR